MGCGCWGLAVRWQESVYGKSILPWLLRDSRGVDSTEDWNIVAQSDLFSFICWIYCGMGEEGENKRWIMKEERGKQEAKRCREV